MHSYQTHHSCLECNSAKQALQLVDKKLDAASKRHYAQITHMASSPLYLKKIRDLIYYKTILSRLVFNPSYYATPLIDIISKVKTISL